MDKKPFSIFKDFLGAADNTLRKSLAKSFSLLSNHSALYPTILERQNGKNFSVVLHTMQSPILLGLK